MKRVSEMDDALRELAKLRDGLLRTVPALSPGRRAVLTRFLAAEFPLEAAVRKAARKRDQLLNPHSPKIPVLVESALHLQLQAVEAAREEGCEWRASHWRIRGWAWLRIFRSPLGAVLTACAVITAAILCFGGWRAQPRSKVAGKPPSPAGMSLESAVTLDRSSSNRAELFGRRITIGPFNLNTSEPASLEASFVANRRIQFADSVETPLGLRLDLPVRATLMEDGLARTP